MSLEFDLRHAKVGMRPVEVCECGLSSGRSGSDEKWDEVLLARVCLSEGRVLIGFCESSVSLVSRGEGDGLCDELLEGGSPGLLFAESECHQVVRASSAAHDQDVLIGQ